MYIYSLYHAIYNASIPRAYTATLTCRWQYKSLAPVIASSTSMTRCLGQTAARSRCMRTPRRSSDQCWMVCGTALGSCSMHNAANQSLSCCKALRQSHLASNSKETIELMRTVSARVLCLIDKAPACNASEVPCILPSFCNDKAYEVIAERCRFLFLPFLSMSLLLCRLQCLHICLWTNWLWKDSHHGWDQHRAV